MAKSLKTKLAEAIAGVVLKTYFGPVAGTGLSIIVGHLIEKFSASAATKAGTIGTDIGTQIVDDIWPAFENEHAGINKDAVITSLVTTFNQVDHQLFLEEGMNTTRIINNILDANFVEPGLNEAETALYKKATEKIVADLRKVAVNLPAFQADQIEDSISRFEDLSKNLHTLLSKVDAVSGSIANVDKKTDDIIEKLDQFIEEPEDYERNVYRPSVMQKENYVELVGIDVRNQDEATRQNLTDAYVTLSLERKSDNDDDDPDLMSAAAYLDSLKDGHCRLLLRGHAGSGKSTLMRWIAVESAQGKSALARALMVQTAKNFFPVISSVTSFFTGKQDFLTSSALPSKHGLFELFEYKRSSGIFSNLNEVKDTLARNWRLRVPFIIRLRQYPDGELPSIAKFYSLSKQDIAEPQSRRWAETILKNGRGIILIDGVDEVAEQHRGKIKDYIEKELIGPYPDNIYIVTTRPKGVAEGWLSSLNFSEGSVHEMSLADQELFIKKWHLAASKKAGAIAKDIPGLTENLITLRRSTPPWAPMASYPLLLAAICALHYARLKLPTDESELCESLIGMLLYKREQDATDYSKIEFKDSFTKLGESERRMIVGDLAYYMTEENKSELTDETATMKIAQTLRQMRDIDENEAEDVLDKLKLRSGIMREPRTGYVDFLHNTLREYMAAGRFVQEHKAGTLAARAPDDDWMPVLLFSVNTDSEKFANDLINELMSRAREAASGKSGKIAKEAKRPYEFAAVRCAQSARRMDPKIRARVDKVRSSLFPPRSFTEADALAKSGDWAIVHLRHPGKKIPARQAAACIRALRQIDTDAARNALRGYLADTRPTVYSQLIGAVDPLEILAIRRQVIGPSSYNDLFVSAMSNVSSLEALRTETAIKHLNLSFTKLTTLPDIIDYSHLEEIDISISKISDISALTGTKNIKRADIYVSNIKTLDPISENIGLSELRLFDSDVESLDAIRDCRQINILDISSSKIDNLDDVIGMDVLSEFDASDSLICDLSPLRGKNNLRYLTISNTKVADISPLAECHGLIYLDIQNTMITDLSPLKNCLNLTSLLISKDMEVNASVLSHIHDLTISPEDPVPF